MLNSIFYPKREIKVLNNADGYYSLFADSISPSRDTPEGNITDRDDGGQKMRQNSPKDAPDYFAVTGPVRTKGKDVTVTTTKYLENPWPERLGALGAVLALLYLLGQLLSR